MLNLFKKIKPFLIMIVLIAMIIAIYPVRKVYAGISPSNISLNLLDVETENGETKQEIDTSLWMASDDVINASREKNIIVFGENSNRNSKVIFDKKISKLDYLLEDISFTGQITMNLLSVTEDVKFGLALGYRYVTSGFGFVNSSFLWFTKKSSEIKIGLSNYNETSVETVLDVKPTNLVEGKPFVLDLTVHSNNKIDVLLNSEIVNFTSNEIYFEGYLGFVQTQKTLVEISDVNIRAFENLRPRNENIFETFDRGDFNGVVLTTSSANSTDISNRYASKDYPDAYAGVENGKLVFKRGVDGFVATKQEYSNVDVSFDIKFDTNSFLDANGVLRKETSAGLAFVFGAPSYSTVQDGQYQLKIVKKGISLIDSDFDAYIMFYSNNNLLCKQKMPKKYNVFDYNIANNYSFSINVQFFDGIISMKMKNDKEDSFTSIFSYNVYETNIGYVQIKSLGSLENKANYSIDNLSFTNFDNNSLVEKTKNYHTNYWNLQNFDYIDSWDDSDLLR